jgi:hypothetical protein
MLKRLDAALPLAESSELAETDTAGRFYLGCRGIPDYLMTLVRGGVAEALARGGERIERSDLARVFERRLALQRVLAEQANPFIGPLDATVLDRVQAADETRAVGVGLTPRAARRRPQPVSAAQLLGGA